MRRDSFKAAACLAAAFMPVRGLAADPADMRPLQRQLEQLQKQSQQQIKALEVQIEHLRQKMTEPAAEPPAPVEPATPSAANAFNPAIGIILSGQAAYFSRDPDRYRIPGFVLGDEVTPGVRGLSLAETELNASANVDDLFYGQLTAAFGADNEVGIEEAYIQTLALPYGFSLRAGRFKSAIGYLNSQHAHVWDFVDPPLAYRAMLNNQYADDGVRLTWLAPTDLFLELGSEVFRGDAFPASGAARGGFGSYTVFAHVGGDVGVSHSWLAGLSRLSASAEDRDTDGLTFSGDNAVNIADLVWKWAPNGNPYDVNFKLQTEYLWGDESGTYTGIGATDVNRRGWYAQGIYQFRHGWRLGLRYDAVSSNHPGAAFAGTALDSAGHHPRRYTAMVDFANSEFSRIRLQYNRDDSGPSADNQVFLQYQMSLGAHGAHQY